MKIRHLILILGLGLCALYFMEFSDPIVAPQHEGSTLGSQMETNIQNKRESDHFFQLATPVGSMSVL